MKLSRPGHDPCLIEERGPGLVGRGGLENIQCGRQANRGAGQGNPVGCHSGQGSLHPRVHQHHFGGSLLAGLFGGQCGKPQGRLGIAALQLQATVWDNPNFNPLGGALACFFKQPLRIHRRGFCGAQRHDRITCLQRPLRQYVVRSEYRDWRGCGERSGGAGER